MRVEQRVQAQQQRFRVGRGARRERETGRVFQHHHEARIFVAHMTFGGGDGALNQRLRLVEPS